MVDFDSAPGPSDFETAGVRALRRECQHLENAGLGRNLPFLDGHWLTEFIKFPARAPFFSILLDTLSV
jgi:hypothetical protein